jgi:hypothetical protein
MPSGPSGTRGVGGCRLGSGPCESSDHNPVAPARSRVRDMLQFKLGTAGRLSLRPSAVNGPRKAR